MANEKRLIDANALEEAIRTDYWEHFTQCHDTDQIALIDMVCEDIGNAPTVDAVEVVHGGWVFGTANHREYMKCSVCLKSQTPTGVFTYCPNCGAKMDGGNEDGTAQV